MSKIQQFLQRKVASFVDQYFEFEKLMLITAEGMTIKNSKIKPKLAELLSQVLHMPLQLISGSISSLTLNKPWEKLFFFMNSSIKIAIQDVYIKTKLPSSVNEDYLLKAKESLIQRITQGLFNPLQAILHHNHSYINKKLKEYFLSTIILEVKNVCLQIQVDLKQRIVLILKVDSLRFRKQDKNLNESEKIHLEINGAGVYYKAYGSEQVQFISPTNIEFERIKTQNSLTHKRSSIKTLKIQKLQLNVNNINYGDIARIFLLIQWHNAFESLPYSLWKQRPFILNELKPLRKLQYIVHLIQSSIKQNNFSKQLVQRRIYINLYEKLLTNANQFTPENKFELLRLEKQMPTWKIIAFRNFCINIYKNKILAKKKKNQQLQMSINQKGQSLASAGWFSSWSASQKNKDQLQEQFLKKINTIEFVPDDIQSIFYVSVDKVKVKLSIVTQFGIQPFISLVGTDCSFKNTQFLLDKTWEKHIQIIRCKVEYEKYLGHCERYRNFISECKEHLNESQLLQSNQRKISEDDMDQFEEIGKFLQINFKHDSQVIAINLLPFDIYLNHEVFQKFSILLNLENLSKLTKLDKLQENFINKIDPWSLVEKQKQKIIELKRSQQSQSMKLSGSFNKVDNISVNNENNDDKEKPQVLKQLLIKTAFNIIIPYDFRSTKSPELVIQIAQISFSKKDIIKTIDLKGILIKYKMAEKQESQDEQYTHIVQFLAPRMEQRIIIRRFNIKITKEQHNSFDKNLIVIDPINIELPPQYFLFSLIQLIYMHIPKSKQNRLKQYYRRKQSIGQQFIDACQNLKEHIAKSMIMSSERMTKKSIILQKRTKQLQVILRGMSITQKDFQLLVGQAVIHYHQISFDNQSLSSNNQKKIKLTVHNLKRLQQAVKNIQLHITKQSIKRGLNNNEKAKSPGLMNYLNIQVSQINLQAVISLKHLKSNYNPSLNLDIKSIQFQTNIQTNSKYLHANISLFYDEQIPNSQRYTQIPFLEPCQVTYREDSKFNLLKRSLYINTLSINIKPSLFKFVAKALKDYHLQEGAACHVVNGTINTIKIKKSHQNYYHQYKHNHKFTTENYYCEMLLFGIKYQLQFNQHHDEIPKQKIQRIVISENNFLINSETSPNNYVLQSNIRILNHQDKTLWLKITQTSSSIITSNYQAEKEELHRLSLTPKRKIDIDLTQRIDDDQISRGSSYFKTSSKRNTIYSPQIEKSKLSGKTINIPLKPKEKVNLLIDSNDHKFLHIFDQGVNFTELRINQLFEDSERLLKGQGELQDQYLVIRSEITTKEGVEGFIYTFHIYSPIYIVNKTPWELQYRLSEEQIGLEQDDSKRMGRRRSFELVPLKKIPILSSQKIRNIHYNQIQTMKLQLNKCERQINSLLNLIASIKQKDHLNRDGFLKQVKLITLRHNKKEIQLILSLEFSTNILKIKLYPQYIFINMTKEIMTFKIKEDQITYPQITLSSINSQNKLEHSKSKSKFIEHISQYINLSDQKIKERDALKQLFQNFSHNLEIFTGKIQQNGTKNMTDSNKIKRKLIYNTTFMNSNLKEFKLLGKSSKGYLSDYGSDGEFREQLTDFTEQNLEEENLLIYSEQKHVFFKRVLNIQGYFNLILISPTVHIINKSQATFHAKSSCENLVTIHKNNHHFIHINQNTIDIQASLGDEQISLNEWMKLDLTRLGTIYYSKDMIQHHGSGYQSKQYTLRKRRMKKTPKIFYRIILCKYQRGQKILIQQSQYPPYTFLNNTSYKIKIEEPKEHFIEEFINKGEMGEYAPKDPYYSPIFRLYKGEKYEYKMLLNFGVDKKQTFTLQKNIIVSIQEYKQKTIVQIKDKNEMDQNANLNMSLIQRSEEFQQYSNLLEEITKFSLQIDRLSINVLNNWNRQLNTNYLQGLNLIYENKNYKDYYKFQITNIEGYDYMDIKPDFIYKRKKKDKLRLGLLHKQKEQQQMFLTFELITNYHKNALLIEKCFIKLDEIVFYLSADLILAYIKNYYEPIRNLIKVHRYYENHHVQNKSDITSKTFIFQSLEWHGTFLKLQTRNLSIMETFLNKQYEKWLVKFINWLGDIKPICIQPLKLTYEQVTLKKLGKHLDFKKKGKEIAQQMMDYPISQLKDVVLFMIGEANINMKEKLTMFYNLAKSLEYIVNFTLSLNENLKSKLKTYNEIFSENQKQNMDIIDKMINFEYCEWKYKKDQSTSRLDKKIKRLQRYNTRSSVLQYDQFKAKIKLALDNHAENKLFKKIEHVYRINSDYIFAIAQQFSIIYCLPENQWTVIPVESILDFSINHMEIQLTFLDEPQQKQFHSKKTNLKTMRFKNIELNQDHITEINGILQDNKLSSYY